MTKNNLRISNMVFTGKLPFVKKFNEAERERLINKADFMIVNEENSPILSKRIPLRKNPKLSVHNKEKQPYVSIWYTGAINIVGVISRKEADEVYEIVLKDIKRVCRRVLRK